MEPVMTKRKHKTLYMLEKNDILERLEKGESLMSVAKVYGVGRTTIYDIKKNRDKIKAFLETNEKLKSKRQTLKAGANPKVDDSLYAWFLQERRRHKRISGKILKRKAKDFYREITKKNDFRASEGWLQRYKKRFGIRLLRRKAVGELSWDESPKVGQHEESSVEENEQSSFDGYGGSIKQEVVEEEKERISHDAAISALSVSITWAEENGVSAEDVLVLRKLKEQALNVVVNCKNENSME